MRVGRAAGGLNMSRTAVSIAAALAFASLPSVAAAQGRQDFRLTNANGYDIAEVYVAPTSSDDWEDDVMGEDTLDDAQNVTIHFPLKAKQCLYDIKVVWTDGDNAE